jgi:hypothetical protein
MNQDQSWAAPGPAIRENGYWRITHFIAFGRKVAISGITISKAIRTSILPTKGRDP